jgi:hypothetical protein
MRSRQATCPPGDYVLTWRLVLDTVWSGLDGDPRAFKHVAGALADFDQSPYFHNDGPAGPVEADDNAVASAYYAAECFIHGCAEFAFWAAERAIDEVDAVIQREEDQAGDLRMIGPADVVRWELDPRMQEELHRQSARLHYLAGHQNDSWHSPPIRHALITRLRDGDLPGDIP